MDTIQHIVCIKIPNAQKCSVKKWNENWLLRVMSFIKVVWCQAQQNLINGLAVKNPFKCPLRACQWNKRGNLFLQKSCLSGFKKSFNYTGIVLISNIAITKWFIKLPNIMSELLHFCFIWKNENDVVELLMENEWISELNRHYGQLAVTYSIKSECEL